MLANSRWIFIFIGHCVGGVSGVGRHWIGIQLEFNISKFVWLGSCSTFSENSCGNLVFPLFLSRIEKENKKKWISSQSNYKTHLQIQLIKISPRKMKFILVNLPLNKCNLSTNEMILLSKKIFKKKTVDYIFTIFSSSWVVGSVFKISLHAKNICLLKFFEYFTRCF